MGFWEILVLIAVFTKKWSPFKGLIIWIISISFTFNYIDAEKIKSNNIKQFEYLVHDGNYNSIIEIRNNSFMYYDYEWFDESVKAYDFKCNDKVQTIRIKDIKHIDNGECFKISELDDTFIKYENAKIKASNYRYNKMVEVLRNYNINIELNNFTTNMKSDNYVEYIRKNLEQNNDDNFLFIKDSTMFNTVFKNN